MPTDPIITVALDEEHGYRQWVWHTGMTAAELMAFWKRLPTVMPYFMTPVGLPGELIQVVEDTTTLDTEVERINADSSLSEDERKGQVRKAHREAPYTLIRFDNGEPAPERQPEWWDGHLHMDCDSVLTTADGRHVFHAGFAPQRGEGGLPSVPEGKEKTPEDAP